MKRTEIEKAINNYRNNTLANVKDRGSKGKVLEVLTRDYILVNGIGSIEDCCARRLGKDDIRTMRDGTIEVKTNAGAVCYGNGFTTDDLIADNVMPNVKLIVWYPWAECALANVNPYEYGWVFTREQFIDTLEQLGRNGLRSMIHVTSKGRQINLQALSPKHEEKLYNILENLPTVWEYWSEE